MVTYCTSDGVALAIPKPRREDRLVTNAQRKTARRSALTRNTAGAALPKPEVWHCTAYRSWCTKRFDCAIKGKAGHVCGPRVDHKVVKEFCHFEPEGRGLKTSDNRGMVMCAEAHRIQTETSWSSFVQRFGIDREEIAQEMFNASRWSDVEVSW